MAIGTAGYTAMLCVLALERHGLQPGDGEVLVTSATGGVGSVATALLGKLGHRVVAATGKAAEADHLPLARRCRRSTAPELAAPGKPLQKERWAAVVDAVGSHTLANACAQTRYGGVVAACGLAQAQTYGDALHPAWRDAGRRRQRDGASAAAPRSLAAPRARSRPEAPQKPSRRKSRWRRR